jgi:myosin heavy subunit
MDSNNRTKLLLISLLIATTLTSRWFLIKNNSLKIEASKEKSVSAAEKDLLNKEVNELAMEKRKLADENSTRKAKIDSLMGLVDIKNNEVRNLLAVNADAKNLRKKLKELEQVRNELKNEVDYLKQNETKLNLTNSNLESELSRLKTEIENLHAELLLSKNLSSDYILVRNLKRNQKITAFASRTKVINVSFDYPSGLVNTLEVTVETPGGKTYSSAEKEFVSVTPSNAPALESSSPTPLKRMDLNFKPGKKLAKGIYKFNITNGKEVVNSILVQLK